MLFKPCCPSSIYVCAILYNFAVLENKCMYVRMYVIGRYLQVREITSYTGGRSLAQQYVD